MKRIGNIDDPQFVSLFLLVLSYPLTGREINYLMWRFYFRMTTKEIAKFDGLKITRQAVNLVIVNAYKKIKLNFRKSYYIL